MDTLLPENFDPNAKIVILAGRGYYPQLLWERIRQRGLSAYVIAFEESCESWLKGLPSHDYEFMAVGQIGKLLKRLEGLKARYVMLAGQITPKRLFQGLKPDFKAICLLASLKEKNATTLFGSIIQAIEKLGIEVLDARCFLEDQLTTAGTLVACSVKVPENDLALGVKVLKEVSALDVGQGLVVCNGTIIAVEAFEGTDAMLLRAGDLCNKAMGFVKMAKQTQDYRYDVPVFGLRTLEKMHEAHIQWAALEVGKTLILQKDEVLQKARQYKIQIKGFL